jgi:hypothetical protein
LLNEFAAVLSAQVHAIDQALNSAMAGVEELPPCPFDQADAREAIVRLKTLLESNDGSAGEAFRAVSTAVSSLVEKSQLEILRNAIDDFEFETALFQLEYISNLCTTNGKSDESA